MKKLTPLLFALGMSASLIACSNHEPSTPSKGSSSLSQKELSESKNTFSEIVAIDNEYCSIKLTELDPDNIWGYTVKAELENKSADKNYMFSIENAAINGVSANPLFATEVAPSKKALKEINFADHTLKENGIGDCTDIEITFRVYVNDDWAADPVAKETVHIYPYGEEQATHFVRNSQPSDTVLVDNDQVSVIVTGYDPEGTFGYTVNLYFVNKTDKNIMFSVDDAAINGFMIDPFYANSVPAGKSAFSSMHWSDRSLEESKISDVEQIEFTLTASDEDDWLAEDLVNQAITLKP